MMLSNGYTKLPPGKLANAVTWLELTDLTLQHLRTPAGYTLRQLVPEDASLHHTLYRSIGTPWLWAGLINKSEAEIAAYLDRENVKSFAVFEADEPVGMLDLEITPDGSDETGIEVVYFGFIPSHIGKGAGAWLMGEGKRLAAENGERRLWLHTCGFDHPRAVAFYQRQGFRIYAQGYEVMDDPRHLGLLPKDAAKHVPLMSNSA